MSSEHSEVRKLVDSLAKLMKPLLNRPAEKESTKAKEKVKELVSAVGDSNAPAVRQWQQGKGVVLLEDSVLVTGEKKVVKEVVRVEKSVDRLAKMLKDAPKPERVAAALFGMQVRDH